MMVFERMHLVLLLSLVIRFIFKHLPNLIAIELCSVMLDVNVRSAEQRWNFNLFRSKSSSVFAAGFTCMLSTFKGQAALVEGNLNKVSFTHSKACTCEVRGIGAQWKIHEKIHPATAGSQILFGGTRF